MNNQQIRHWLHAKSKDNNTAYHSPLLMGILNVTPDSFSESVITLDEAKRQALSMQEQGADLIDIGGESTRPGAALVSVQEELDRTIPVIEALVKESDICISIDTSKPEVMKAAVAAGAGLINDVCALSREGSLLTAAQLQVPVILMHMRGTPVTMQQQLDYPNGLMHEIHDFFATRITQCQQQGLDNTLLLLDPGFGFAKSLEHNLQIMHHFSEFRSHCLPLVLGVSRKSSLGIIVNKPVHERLIAGIAMSVMAAMNGVSILRTHDVDATRQALQTVEAVQTRGLK